MSRSVTCSLLFLLACGLGIEPRPLAFSAGSVPGPIAILRDAATSSEGGERPSPDQVLGALAQAQKHRPPLSERSLVFKRFVASGKTWRLTYVGSSDQMKAARSGSDSLPGLYVDGFINYALSFAGEGDAPVKTEGVSGNVLGMSFFVGDLARWKWPRPETRTTMVIESTANVLRAFGQEWLFPAEGVTPGSVGDSKFQEAPVRKKSSGGDFTTINVLYVDDVVAVVQAESGAVALYSATSAE